MARPSADPADRAVSPPAASVRARGSPSRVAISPGSAAPSPSTRLARGSRRASSRHPAASAYFFFAAAAAGGLLLLVMRRWYFQVLSACRLTMLKYFNDSLIGFPVFGVKVTVPLPRS